MLLISHELRTSDSPLGRQFARPHWRFPFSYDFYDRQALVLAGMTATDLFSTTRIPNQRFVIATIQDFFSQRVKRFILSLHVISGDSLHGKVFSLVGILLDSVIVK
jgi:hypothetical protein